MIFFFNYSSLDEKVDFALDINVLFPFGPLAEGQNDQLKKDSLKKNYENKEVSELAFLAQRGAKISPQIKVYLFF